MHDAHDNYGAGQAIMVGAMPLWCVCVPLLWVSCRCCGSCAIVDHVIMPVTMREHETALLQKQKLWFQEVNETMEMQSPFDGLEGATGGTDYDSTNYGRHCSQTRSSGNSEVSRICFYSCFFQAGQSSFIQDPNPKRFKRMLI